MPVFAMVYNSVGDLPEIYFIEGRNWQQAFLRHPLSADIETREHFQEVNPQDVNEWAEECADMDMMFDCRAVTGIVDTVGDTDDL